MTADLPSPQNKTLSDLAREAVWFALHSVAALAILFVLLAAMTLTHPDPEQSSPKVMATALAFLVPLVAAFLIVRIRRDQPGTAVARHLWIAALLLFTAVCVWVLDLPTGVGLCESCDATEKLYRTVFSIDNGSGLMGGDGLLAGAWMPLALLGYAAGAALGLEV